MAVARALLVSICCLFCSDMICDLRAGCGPSSKRVTARSDARTGSAPGSASNSIMARAMFTLLLLMLFTLPDEFVPAVGCVLIAIGIDDQRFDTIVPVYPVEALSRPHHKHGCGIGIGQGGRLCDDGDALRFISRHTGCRVENMAVALAILHDELLGITRGGDGNVAGQETCQ